jgi:hypothetical protein
MIYRSGLFQPLMINAIVHNEMKKILLAVASLVSLCLLIVLLNTTAPVTAGPFGILAVFLFAYLILLLFIAYSLHFVSMFAAHLSVSFVSRRPLEVLSLKKSYYFSSVISAAPIMMVAIQSVGSVDLYGLLLVTLFVLIGCLYVSKRAN